MPDDRYSVIDHLTGERLSWSEYEQRILKDAEDEGYFEMTDKETLMRFIECTESPGGKVLNALLKKKWKNGKIEITQQELIAITGASKNTVNSVMKRLQDRGLLRKLKQGSYVLNPGVSVYGGNIRRLARIFWEKAGA